MIDKRDFRIKIYIAVNLQQFIKLICNLNTTQNKIHCKSEIVSSKFINELLLYLLKKT